MGYHEKKRVEEKVFQAIDDIAEELDIPVKNYPEVYLVNNQLQFEDLWLPENKREDFEDNKELRCSWYDDRPPMVFIGKEDPVDISEESAHFLHFQHSKIRYSGRSNKDKFALNVIVELIGYFCSKLIVPSRKNNYSDNPDLFFMKPNERVDFLKDLSLKNGKYGQAIADEFYLYQQARGLGERMYWEYISGKMPLKEFKKLFSSKFEGNNKPSYELMGLKMKFWLPKDFNKRIVQLVQ